MNIKVTTRSKNGLNSKVLKSFRDKSEENIYDQKYSQSNKGYMFKSFHNNFKRNLG